VKNVLNMFHIKRGVLHGLVLTLLMLMISSYIEKIKPTYMTSLIDLIT